MWLVSCISETAVKGAGSLNFEVTVLDTELTVDVLSYFDIQLIG